MGKNFKKTTANVFEYAAKVKAQVAKSKSPRGKGNATPGNNQENILLVSVPSTNGKMVATIKNAYECVGINGEPILTHVRKLNEGEKVAKGNTLMGNREYKVNQVGFARNAENTKVFMVVGYEAGTKPSAGIYYAKMKNFGGYFAAFMDKKATIFNFADYMGQNVEFEIASEATEFNAILTSIDENKKKHNEQVTLVGYELSFIGATERTEAEVELDEEEVVEDETEEVTEEAELDEDDF